MSLADTITPGEALCVQLALNVLPDSALQAIIVAMDAAIANLNAAYVLFITQLANLDFALAPLVAEKNALLALQQTVVAQFKILDQAVVIQCAALGNLNQSLLASIDDVTEAITNTLNMINMKEALKTQIQAKSAVALDTIEFLGRVKSVFQTALQVRTQARVVGQLPGLKQTVGSI